MSEKPISPLRQRMIEDMSVRNFVEKTLRHVKTFTAFLGRSPDTATPEDLRRFQLHQTRTGVRPPTINNSVAALRVRAGNFSFVPIPDSCSAAKEVHRLQRCYAVAAVRHNAKADYGIASSNSIRSSVRTATVGSELKICHRLTDIGPGFAV
jgi:hypothetical protein